MVRALLIVALVVFFAGRSAVSAEPSEDEKQAVKELIAGLTEFSTDKRVRVYRDIAAMGPKAKAAVPHLCKKLETDLTEPGLIACLEALGAIGDSSASAAIGKLDRSTSYTRVREACKVAKSRLVTDDLLTKFDAKVVPKLDDLLNLQSAIVDAGQSSQLEYSKGKYRSILELHGKALYKPTVERMVARGDANVNRLAGLLTDVVAAELVHETVLPHIADGGASARHGVALLKQSALRETAAFGKLLDRCLVEPAPKYGLEIAKLAIEIDGPGAEYKMAMLASKSTAARRLAAADIAKMDAVPKSLLPTVRALLDDGDVDLRKAAAAVFQLDSNQQNFKSSEWVAMIGDENPEKRMIAMRVVTKLRPPEATTKLLAIAERPDAPNAKECRALVLQILDDLRGQQGPLNPTHKMLVKELTSNRDASVRAAAISTQARPELFDAVDFAGWKAWSEDKSDAVRRSSLAGLLQYAERKKSVEAAARIKELKNDADPALRSEVELLIAQADPNFRLDLQSLGANTKFVLHVQLKTLFDYLPVKRLALPELKEFIKKRPTFQKFKFDAMTDMTSLTLVAEERFADRVAILRGNFAKEEKLAYVEVDDFEEKAFAVCISDSIILGSGSKERIALASKPLAEKKQPEWVVEFGKQLPGPKDGSLAWVAIPASAIDDYIVGLFKQIGIDGEVFKEGLKVLTLKLAVVRGKLKFTIAAAMKDKKAARDAVTVFDNLVEAVKVFGPLVASSQPNFNPMDDFLKNFNPKTSADGAIATLEFEMSDGLVESILRAMLGKGD